MPVRSTIHSLVVSTWRARSSLVTRRSGTAAPMPANCTARRTGGVRTPRAAGSRATTVTPAGISQGAEPGDRLALAHPLTVVDQQAHHPAGEAGADRHALALVVDVADDLAGVEDFALGGDDLGLHGAELAQAGGDDDLFGHREAFPGEGGGGGIHHGLDRGH